MADVGVLGEMFPSQKLRSEAGEAGSGQRWRLGPIDLDTDVVVVHHADPDDDAEPPASDDPPSSHQV